MITIIIPAHNEQGYIGDCLTHILWADDPGTGATARAQVVVVANGCTDDTTGEARAFRSDFAARGWQLDVLEIGAASKTQAINAGEQAAVNDILICIDADVHVSPSLLASMARCLDRPDPAYASGRPKIRTARTMVSRYYAEFWLRLPFMARGVPGCGVYGVNAAGRARWGRFPEVTSDDCFVRNHFAPDEMHAVPATYSWPIAEGFGDLVKVRRRQDRGLEELKTRYPDLPGRTACTSPDLGQTMVLFLRDPLGFAVYTGVAVAVHSPLFQVDTRWYRGR